MWFKNIANIIINLNNSVFVFLSRFFTITDST